MLVYDRLLLFIFLLLGCHVYIICKLQNYSESSIALDLALFCVIPFLSENYIEYVRADEP